MPLDLSTQSFSLANARICALASAGAYHALNDADRRRIGAVSQSRIESAEAHVTISSFPNVTLIAWRGTHEIRDVLTDVEFWRRNLSGGLKVHAGIYNSVADIIDRLDHALTDSTLPIVVTGHSLGGGQAPIGAGWLRTLGHDIHSVITFGAPRWCDPGYARKYNQNKFPLYRVTNGTDPVPWIPWLWNSYRHAGIEEFMPGDDWPIIEAPSLARKVWNDAEELFTLWNDLRSGRAKLWSEIPHHPIERYIEKIGA